MPTVAVIIPALNAQATLPACLAAIAALTIPVDDIIVFSDGSTDRTDAIAQAAGARVIRNAGAPQGPAHGRNVAAAAAGADLLLFIDADVVVAPDALALLLADLAGHHAAATFGSYDDHPSSRRTASLYVNLRHHFIHQHTARDATTFWSGLGLIDRRIFLASGGYDAARFAQPSIEDVDLGMRLIAAGHTIRVVPEAQATHLKDWSLWNLWHTDIVRRAYPWSCLLVEGARGRDLNLSPAERTKTLAAIAFLASLAIAPIWPLALVPGLTAGLVFGWLNRRFFGLLARRMSPFACAQAIGLHWCYYLYSAATYAVVLIKARLGADLPKVARPLEHAA